jgi:hypothetical protein
LIAVGDRFSARLPRYPEYSRIDSGYLAGRILEDRDAVEGIINKRVIETRPPGSHG